MPPLPAHAVFMLGGLVTLATSTIWLNSLNFDIGISLFLGFLSLVPLFFIGMLMSSAWRSSIRYSETRKLPLMGWLLALLFTVFCILAIYWSFWGNEEYLKPTGVIYAGFLQSTFWAFFMWFIARRKTERMIFIRGSDTLT